MDAKPAITLRHRLPLIWLLLLLLAAVVLPGRVWNTLLIGLGGLVIIAYYWARQLARGLHGRRELQFGWVAVGDRLSEQFEIGNSGWLPALWVEVEDHSTVPGYQPAVVRSVGGHGKDQWRQAAVCRQRGQFHLGPWALHSADPFGLFQVTIPYPQTSNIIIHPPIHIEVPIPLPAGQSSGRSQARDRSWQATINAASVRNYQPNDPIRWIHWPTTARRDQLFVREFDLDVAGDIWFLLDMASGSQVGRGADGTEEHMVLLAAALAAQALRQQRAAGLAGYGQEPQIVPPGRGQGQQWRLLRALALVKADGTGDLARSLRDLGRVVRRGSAVVIITPTGRSDWLPELLRLAQSGIRSQVILLDRATFAPPGAAGGPEPAEPEASTRGLHDALRQIGVYSHIIAQGEVGRPAEEAQRRGFWEFRVTGTGKVVAVRSPYDSPASGKGQR
jgi:uncharacterized protein (DUF58 family)